MRELDPKEEGALDGTLAHIPYAIKNDIFDIRFFEALKQHSPNLLKSEEEGRKEYDQYPELQQDVYDALYKYEPELNPETMIKRDHLLNRKIMEKLMESQRYKELRAMTEMDVVNSTIGTELMSEETLALLKEAKKEREALQQVIDAGNALDAAKAAGQKPTEAGEESDQENQDGNTRSKEEMELEEAERRYEEAMENFEELTERKDFQKSIERLAAKVKDSVKETNELISSWGLGRSESFQKKSPHEKMELLNRLRSSPKLKQIAKLAGRYRKLSQTHRKERVKQGLDSTYGIKQGSDISRLLPSETMRLLSTASRDSFLLDLMEGKTLQYQISGKQKKGKGPVIACIDSSGSMDGVPEVLLDTHPKIVYNTSWKLNDVTNVKSKKLVLNSIKEIQRRIGYLLRVDLALAR